jgi:hypothetical protein
MKSSLMVSTCFFCNLLNHPDTKGPSYLINDGLSRSGLELGLRHMREGETGLIRASPKYAYGPIGRKKVAVGAAVEVPPNAEVRTLMKGTSGFIGSCTLGGARVNGCPSSRHRRPSAVPRSLVQPGVRNKKLMGLWRFHQVEYEVEVKGLYPVFNPKEAPTITRVTEASLKKQVIQINHLSRDDPPIQVRYEMVRPSIQSTQYWSLPSLAHT